MFVVGQGLRLCLIMCAKPLGVIWQPLKSFALAYFSTSSSFSWSFTSKVLPGCTTRVMNRLKLLFILEMASGLVELTLFFITSLLIFISPKAFCGLSFIQTTNKQVCSRVKISEAGVATSGP